MAEIGRLYRDQPDHRAASAVDRFILAAERPGWRQRDHHEHGEWPDAIRENGRRRPVQFSAAKAWPIFGKSRSGALPSSAAQLGDRRTWAEANGRFHAEHRIRN